MNLIVDMGNTRTKYAIFEKNKIVFEWSNPSLSSGLTKFNFKKYPKLQYAILCAVKEKNVEEVLFLKKHFRYYEVTAATPLPVKNKYKTPKTLGKDRLANAAAAAAIFPAKDILIIDTGTCIKYDFIDKKKNYWGGAISPGLQMRFKALNNYTGRLPLLQPAKKFRLTGNNTKQSILSGVQNGMIFEIKGVINAYRKKYKNLNVILTGGDQAFFANHLKNSIFAAPNLTLHGLNEILNYNVHKKQ